MPDAPAHARPEDVADHARSSWDDELLECRMDRHDYRPLDASINEQEGTFTRVRRCSRCYTEEHLLRSLRTGEKIHRRLDYSNTKEGYLLPAGTGRMTTSSNNEVWREYFNRLKAAQAARKKTARKRATKKRAA